MVASFALGNSVTRMFLFMSPGGTHAGFSWADKCRRAKSRVCEPALTTGETEAQRKTTFASVHVNGKVFLPLLIIHLL